MAVDLTIDQKVKVSLAITDRAGNPAQVDNPPAWFAAPEGFVTINSATDGMSADIVSGDKTAEAVLVTVKADADLGDGVREIVGTLQVNLVGGEAKFVALTAGTPEAKA